MSYEPMQISRTKMGACVNCKGRSASQPDLALFRTHDLHAACGVEEAVARAKADGDQVNVAHSVYIVPYQYSITKGRWDAQKKTS